jgi:hypothetical protein
LIETNLGRLAAVAAASAVVALAGCGEEDEIDTPGDVQEQIDDLQQEAEDQVDDAQDAIEDPVGEGAEEAQDQLNQELQGEGE